MFDGLHHNKTEPSTEPAKEETQENNNVYCEDRMIMGV